MKRFVSMFVVLSLCLCMMPARADIWDTLKLGFGSAVDTAKDAWEVVSEAATDAWNGVESAAESAINWVEGKKDDVWKWAMDTATGAWDWSKAAVGSAEKWISQFIGNAGDTLDSLKAIYDEACTKLGIAADQAADMWNGLIEYAKANNISADKLVKLVLAALISVTGDDLGNADAAQQARDYLNQALGTDNVWAAVQEWLNEAGIDDESAADESLNQLESAVTAD